MINLICSSAIFLKLAYQKMDNTQVYRSIEIDLTNFSLRNILSTKLKLDFKIFCTSAVQTCPSSLVAPINGYISSGSNDVGTTRYYYCYTGYYGTHSNTNYCQYNGQWTGTSFYCTIRGKYSLLDAYSLPKIVCVLFIRAFLALWWFKPRHCSDCLFWESPTYDYNILKYDFSTKNNEEGPIRPRSSTFYWHYNVYWYKRNKEVQTVTQ